MTASPPAGWFPDPYARYEHRYWDGVQWTAHVASRGVQGLEPPAPPQPVTNVATPRPDPRVQRQLERSGIVATSQISTGSMLTERVLIVNQKAKLFESRAEYGVFDRNGVRVGAVRELRRNFLEKSMSARPDEDQTRRLQIIDGEGAVLMSMLRPAKLLKSKMIVSAGGGSPVGQIVQKTVGFIGLIRFDFEVSGRTIGSVTADGWDAWDFGVQDATGDEIARISKDWAGARKELFTKSDNYVLQIHRELEEPLRSLVVATALAIDTALYQGSSNARSKRRRPRLL